MHVGYTRKLVRPQTDAQIIRTELLGHGLAQKSADGLSGNAA